MARFIQESEFDSSVLKSETIAVIGYGNQGRSHALNLMDSGFKVVAGVRSGGKGDAQAIIDGVPTAGIEEAATAADVLMLTLPDEVMASVFKESIRPHLRPGKALLFAHGFNVVFGLLDVPEGVDLGLVAPKGAGAKLRAEFVQGRGLAGLVSVEFDATGKAWDRVLGYAEGLGCFRSLVMETTFREETHTDLFGEQAVLCGGIPELLKAGFETLVEAGYSPEAAYFECIHEAKLITDLIYDRGLAQMRQAISNTAEWGGFMTGRSIIGPESKSAMRDALTQIQNGEFARTWMEEASGGLKRMEQLEKHEGDHASEGVGEVLRRGMGIQKE